MKYLVLLLFFTALTIMAIGTNLLYKEFQLIKVERAKEVQCLKTLISQGIERSDILTIQGECIVSENIYYTHLSK